MSYKTEIIALAVRLVAQNTNLIHKPDAFESALSELFGQETYDQRIARNIEVDAARAAAAVKQFRIDRKFKKITKNV